MLLANGETKDKPNITAGTVASAGAVGRLPENDEAFFHEIEALSKALSLCPPMSRTTTTTLPSTDKLHSHKANSKWSWAQPIKSLTQFHRRRSTEPSRDRRISEIFEPSVGDRSKSLRRVGSVPGLKTEYKSQMIVKPEMKQEKSLLVEISRENLNTESEEIDFVVIDKGIEIEARTGDKGGGESADGLLSSENKLEQNDEHSRLLGEDSFVDHELGSGFTDFSAGDINTVTRNSDMIDEVKSANKSERTHKGSTSFDDAADAIADEFLSMLCMEDETPSRISSFSDQESRAEIYSNKVEKESTTDILTAAVHDNGVKSIRNYEKVLGDLDLSKLVKSVDIERFKAIQRTDSKSRAKKLEGEEAEALMLAWGLDEEAFDSSRDARAFGSPIELSP